MFAIVRTGGKQYRVAAGDRIVVEKIEGDAGARLTLGDVLFTSTGASGITVAAEVVAQQKADKVIVFKKKRRHNYRRKNGHRQQHTILKILSVGDDDGSDRKADADERATATPVGAQAVDTQVAGPEITQAKITGTQPTTDEFSVATASAE